jgi:hypothetical protein
MFPTTYDGTSTTPPYGEAVQATQDADAETDAAPLWRIDGWYSFETFIADDGRGLVRIGPWASKPLADELAIAFYRDGQEVRRYTVADLIDDPESGQRSVSHYRWQKREGGYPRLTGDNRFALQTVEGRVIEFDIETGALR